MEIISLGLDVKVIFACEQGTCVSRRILHNPIYMSVHLELAHMASSDRSHIMY
jgi:hypothetical protein